MEPIIAAFENTRRHLPDCQKSCTEIEFAIMKKANIIANN